MAAKRKRMDVIKEILRMKWVLRRSNRDIALSVGAGRSTVSRVLSRATVAGLSWADVEHSFEDELENRLYGPPRDTVRSGRPEPDMEHIRGELERTGVTLELLHLEYLERHPDGYRYSQFCARYRRWAKSRKVSMHQRHVPGEKMYVDYSGKKPQIIDRHTGESTGVELFVAVLGASNYTYVEATRTQQVRDWIGSHERCMAFFGGVARDLVPDQLKSGVTGSCRYDPVIQKTYREFAQHYGATVIPARPRHPKDKAKVECAVRFAQRWVLARLRNQTFFSLEELNMAIRELLAELNNRPMAERGESRREMFERLERPALRTLPTEPFVYGEWEMARVSESYHVKVDAHYYSVPHACSHDPRTGARALVDVHKSSDTVEIFWVIVALRAMCVGWNGEVTPPMRPICPKDTGRFTTAPPRACKAWLRRLAKTLSCTSGQCLLVGRIQIRRCVRVWACCGWERDIAMIGWMRCAVLPCAHERFRSDMLSVCSGTAWIVCQW